MCRDTRRSRTLGDCFKEFGREAFRLETLDDYGKSGGVDAYRAFLAGEPQPEERKTAAWGTTVGDAVRSGKRIYRVHVLTRLLTDYLRFELSWGYRLDTFTIHDRTLATVENTMGVLILRDSRDIAAHLELFSRLETFALFGDDARERLTAWSAACGGERPPASPSGPDDHR
uniref:DUF6879 family protein n=1 Tax=Streptomyces sp. SID4919 TaxID=2690270 RepID=UPI00315DC8C8